MIPYRLPAGARLSARTAPRAFLPLQLQLRLQHPLLLAVCATLVLLLLDPVTAASAAAERFYPARFYPAAPDTGSAVAIPLAPGESTGLLLLTPSPSGGTVLARVLDESAEPIPGVLVEARTGRFASYGLTDAEGNVRVEGVPAGQVVLRSRPDDPRSLTGAWAIRYAPGTADSAQALRLPLADGGTADFGNVTLPAAGRIKTRVVHGDGAAWADIPVVLRSVDDQDFRRVARTGEEGKVTFAGLEPGSYRLWADMRGTPAITEAWDGTRDTLASAPIEVARGSLIGADSEIAPDLGASMIGVVRNEDTGEGIAGLEVRVFDAGDPAHYRSFTTDELGYYVADGLATGSYKVYAPAVRRWHPSADTWGRARAVALVEPEVRYGVDVRGRPESPCQLAPAASAYVMGFVRADFSILSSAAVRVFNDTDTLETAVTAQDFYVVSCLPPGSYRVAFLPKGRYRTQYWRYAEGIEDATVITATAGDTTGGINFEPEKGVVIEGQVAEAGSGQPIAGAPVLAFLREPGSPLALRGRTDEGGNFRFDTLPDGSGVPAGEWIVGVDSTLLRTLDPTPVVEVGLAAKRQARGAVRLTFRLPESLTIEDWKLERRREGASGDGAEAVRIAGAADHPDGTHAREWIDRDAPNSPASYRLSALFTGSDDGWIASEWVEVSGARGAGAGALAPAAGSCRPQPWDGRSRLWLPFDPAPGAAVTVFRIDGARVGMLEEDGAITATADGEEPRYRLASGGARLPAGVYFVRALDRAGRPHTARLVVERR